MSGSTLRAFVVIIIFFVVRGTFSQTIGYGSSNATLTTKNQENIFTGFEFGLNEIIGPNKSGKILKISHDRSGSPLGALSSLKELLNLNVSALFGFSGSHDSVLVGKKFPKKEMLVIFPGSNHDDIGLLGKNFFTTGHSMKSEINNTLNFINKYFPSQKGLVIIDQQSFVSHSVEKILNQFQSQFLTNCHKFYISKNLNLNEEDMKRIKQGNYKYIYYTSYPDSSLNIANQFESNGIDLPIIAASSWGLGDSDQMRRFILNKKSPLYIYSDWNINSKNSVKFNEKFEKKFGKKPTPENSLGYDLGVIVGTTINRINGDITRENMLEAFRKDFCFKGLSVGELCFNPSGGHSTIKPHFFKFNQNGGTQIE